ncbi:hypothetical protein MTsDn5_23190 [Alteromonas gracilis]|uniref:DUF2987 domain-containing protein n=1 Tax=Alteromonas gracilis TaxID=1479524 RepID=A0ABX5CRA9_9ALTE|nr:MULTISPECIES: DUF2987 domain-containing protein [Alteromonas]APD86375.1 hypothetical protein BM527_09895 [Alteromonas sp. Mex14]PRO69150.1 DUF2987 domain-containing protein [Alteromonas gracilis]GFD70669.1 hypothetical protein KUL113_00890 [Tenacibaculum sp. KUL113]GFD85955.1 hypothetical protein KUL150_20140 [Alteromonas sp. KUL150]
MIRAALFLASSFVIGFSSTQVVAETIDVEYSRFYSHVKKLDNEDTQALQFAFGFVRVGEGRLCGVNAASIVTDKKTMELEVSDEGRFTVPTERALKLANALVRIDLVERANVCDMSVQLETKPEYLKQYYKKEELTFLYEQYEAFFNEMGSFLSFMMPSVKGLMIQFDDKNLDFITPQGVQINNGVLQIEQDWIDDAKGLTLPHAPLRITAMASS